MDSFYLMWIFKSTVYLSWIFSVVIFKQIHTLHRIPYFIISFLCNLFSTFHLHYILDVPLSTTLCNFRAQYRVDAQAAYQQKMLKAFAGKGDFPKIRTFNKSDISTNSVYKDLEAAEKMYVIPSDFI